MHTSQSFHSWFLQLNASIKMGKNALSQPFFTLADYDKILQSSDQSMFNVIMMKKKIDITYAMKVFDQASLGSSCVLYTNLIQPRINKICMDIKCVNDKKKNKVTRRPELNFKDYYEEDATDAFSIDEFHCQHDVDDDSDVFSIGKFQSQHNDDFGDDNFSIDDFRSHVDSESQLSLLFCKEDCVTVKEIDDEEWSFVSSFHLSIGCEMDAIAVKLQNKKEERVTKLSVMSHQTEANVIDDGSSLSSFESFVTQSTWFS